MSKRILLLHIAAICVFYSSQAQVYHTSWKKETPILSSIIGLGIGDLVLRSHIDGLSVEEINDLSRDDIFLLDRFATSKRSFSQDNISDLGMYSSFAYPLLIFLDKPVRDEAESVLIMLGETIALNGVFTVFSKVVVKRNRPLLYNPTVPLEDKLTQNGRMSFFSGHTSNTAALCFFSAKVFSDLNTDSPVKSFVWAGAAAVPLIVGIARVGAGKHFLSDIIVGYGAGAAIGYLIPEFHKVKHDRVSLGVGRQGLLSLSITLDK